MLVQVFEFAYWMNVVREGNVNLYGALLLLLEVVVFGYCVYFWIYKTFPAKIFFQILFWIDLIASTLVYIYAAVAAIASWNDYGPLILIISTVFLASDILECFGVLYLMQNYIPVQTPLMIPQYVLIPA